MSTKMGVGLSDLTDGYACGRQAALLAQQQLTDSSPIALALLFTSHPTPARVLKGTNDVLGDVPLIGGTCVGQYTHEGYVETGAGVMLIQSEHIRFHTTHYQRRLFGRQRLLKNLQGITKDGLGSAYHHRVLVLLPDDRTMNLDLVVDRAMNETGMLYDILGSPSPTTDNPPRSPVIFFNNKVLQGGLSVAEVLSRSPFGIALDNGWSPVSGPYRVTHADERRVIKIDGRPAWEVYEDFLNDHRIAYEQQGLSELTLHYPIGVCDDGTCKVSVLMGFDHSGAMLVTSPPSVGRIIHILATHPNAMITAARRVVERALQRTIAGAGALFIDCMSNGWLLPDIYPQQYEAVRQCLDDMPFLGIRSHGVLARLQGQTVGHYECSVAAWIFPN